MSGAGPESVRIETLERVGRYAFGIKWADGHESIIAHESVRQACSCEDCDGERPEGRPPADAVQPRQVQILADASLFVRWADDHDTLVLLTELRALCRCARCIGEPDRPISGR